MRKIPSASVLLFVCLLPIITFAQADTPGTPVTFSDAELVAFDVCSESLTPGAATVDVSVPPLATAVVGETTAYSVTVTNNLSFDLVDATIVARVFADTIPGSGIPLELDTFVVATGTQIANGQTIELDVIWETPAAAPAGDYTIALYVSDGGQGYLRGLPYTYANTAATIPVTVTSKQTVMSAPYFAMETAVVTGAVYPEAIADEYYTTQYDFTREELPLAMTDNQVFLVDVVNPSSESVTVPIVWNQYVYDNLDPEMVSYMQTETVTLTPLATTTVSFTAAGLTHSRNVVTATIDHPTLRSQVTMAIEKTEVTEVRLHTPALYSFPVRTGEHVNVSVCATVLQVDDFNNHTTPNLIMVVRNSDREVVHEFQRPYPTDNQRLQFSDTFTASRDYDYLSFETLVISGETILVSTRRVYDCETLDDEMCSSQDILSTPSVDTPLKEGVKETPITETSTSVDRNQSHLFLWFSTMVALVIILVILTVLWLIRRTS